MPPLLTILNANRFEDGAYNTALMTSIITSSPTATYIATLGAGWYLPSIYELQLLYNNRYYVEKGLRAVGQTLISSAYEYWSSTEVNQYQAWYFDLSIFYRQETAYKTSEHPVRGVKAF
jgi:hypothetical protein